MRSKEINPIEISRMVRFQVMFERGKIDMSRGKLNLILTCLVSKFMKYHSLQISMIQKTHKNFFLASKAITDGIPIYAH